MGKKLVLIVLVLLLLGGGAAAAYFLLAPQPTEAAAAPAPESPSPGEFVALDPITMPVLRAGAVRKHVTFVLTLELGAGRSYADIGSAMPLLHDAVLTELQRLLGIDWPGGAVIDVEFARRRVLERCRRLLGDGVVADALFQQVQERRV